MKADAPTEGVGAARRGAATRRLTASDAFARVLDRECRRGGLGGFTSLALLRLSRRPDIETLRERLAAPSSLGRALRARLERSFPTLRPVWNLSGGAAPPRVDELPAPIRSDDSRLRLLETRLRPDRGENVRFTLAPGDGGEWQLGFLFHHGLLDALAAQRLLVALSEGTTEAHWPPPAPTPPRLLDRLRLAREQNEAIERAVDGGLYLFCGRDPAPVGALRGERVTLSVEETKAAVRRGRAAAGYGMEGLWYLACALAADRDTTTIPTAGAGAPTGERYLIPLPTTLDRVGERERCFGNHLWFNFLSVPVARAHDPEQTARLLREQLMDELRADAPTRCRAQMELCRPIPAPLYGALAKSTTGGAFASLTFTHPGAVDARLESFLGADVLALDHFPAPLPVPGICATVWSFRGALSLGITWTSGRIDDARAAALLHHWNSRVTGEATHGG